jgi:hypothetical protein
MGIFDAIIVGNTEHLQEEIVNVSLRPLLVPAVAVAAAGAVAFGPTIVAPPALTVAQPVTVMPAVHVADVQLAGFGQDLYYALNGWVQFGVQVAQDFFWWNPGIATGIGNFYAALQPIVETTVNFLATLTQGPAAILGSLTTFVSNLIGIDLSSLTGLLGLASLPVAAVPSAASVGAAPARTSVRTAAGPRAAAVVASPGPVETSVEALVAAPDETPVETLAPVVSRVENRRAARSVTVGTHQMARAAAAQPAQAPAVVDAVDESPAAAVRSSARAARGGVDAPARQARGAAAAAADAS